MADSITKAIDHMEQRLEQLLTLCEQLQEENRVLRESQAHLATERASLLERNEQARARIEAMIGRLRAMEQH